MNPSITVATVGRMPTRTATCHAYLARPAWLDELKGLKAWLEWMNLLPRTDESSVTLQRWCSCRESPKTNGGAFPSSTHRYCTTDQLRHPRKTNDPAPRTANKRQQKADRKRYSSTRSSQKQSKVPSKWQQEIDVRRNTQQIHDYKRTVKHCCYIPGSSILIASDFVFTKFAKK